jgi:hypothetical protein
VIGKETVAVGVPERAPLGLRGKMPGGSAPVSLQVYGGKPDVAVKVKPYGLLTAPIAGGGVVSTSGMAGSFILIVYCALAVAGGVSWSFTSIENVYVPAAVGVPSITHSIPCGQIGGPHRVIELTERPGGSDEPDQA